MKIAQVHIARKSVDGKLLAKAGRSMNVMKIICGNLKKLYAERTISIFSASKPMVYGLLRKP